MKKELAVAGERARQRLTAAPRGRLSKRSRTIARASTTPAHAPTACTTRQPIIAQTLPASAITSTDHALQSLFAGRHRFLMRRPISPPSARN